jgi:hypothetical protein
MGIHSTNRIFLKFFVILFHAKIAFIRGFEVFFQHVTHLDQLEVQATDITIIFWNGFREAPNLSSTLLQVAVHALSALTGGMNIFEP